jgi:hypothetical protein
MEGEARRDSSGSADAPVPARRATGRPAVSEPAVLLATHRLLRERGLGDQPVSRLFTDAHPTLLGYAELRPFQRFALDLGDLVVHPDLVGQLADGETLFAVEAKGEADLVRGLAQAELYQEAFHLTFLAAGAGALSRAVLAFARRKNVGVVAVGPTSGAAAEASLVHVPYAQRPVRDAHAFVARQLDSVVRVTEQTYLLNLPTHYLVWAIVLPPAGPREVDALPGLLAGYPLGGSWRGALRGAEKLGLVRVSGPTARLTDVGAAVKALLPPTLDEWAAVHRRARVQGGATMARACPAAGAALRLLLLHDPMVQLILAGLRTFPGASATFAALAVACDGLDHARAPVFFLKPEAAASLSDDRGRVRWGDARAGDYRSTMYQQYKSVLKHAGLLSPARLGGTSSTSYVPERDVWALADTADAVV